MSPCWRAALVFTAYVFAAAWLGLLSGLMFLHVTGSPPACP